ncbi:MAG: DEAD/DEAH box helicase, partial [Phycisphaerae bacterium]|nr:DEAD/DEAH box helicase [Phycisphaerae bacterium]
MADLTLESPVQYVKGAGPVRAALLERVGIDTVADLLKHLPRDYQFRPEVINIADLREESKSAVCGIIEKITFSRFSRLPRLQIELADSSGCCRVIWFHGGYLRKQFQIDQHLLVWGKVQSYDNILQFANPKFELLKEASFDPRQAAGRIIPVYPAIASLSSGMFAKLIDHALNEVLSLLPEWFSPGYRAARDLPSISQAYRWLHRPGSADEPKLARRRLAYDELFLMELGIAIRHWHTRHTEEAIALPTSEQIEKRIRARFPFPFTPGQEQVTAEIVADLASSRPMNRLLQGDVGSGKTVVALHAVLLAIANGTQAAIMAPTEILADQHFERIEKYLAGSRVRRVLLTGGLTGKARSELLAKIAEGQVDIVVGTQALLEKDVLFNRLGLVVVDEQHKFGVRQRARVRAKGTAPHCLVMTATPIPRTLALTVFGDLDVSILSDFPPGRQPVVTSLIPPDK